MFKRKIENAIQSATGIDTLQIDVPSLDTFGDYSSNVALQLKGEGSPREKAQKLLAVLQSDHVLTEIIEKIEIAGPGFINFWIKKEKLLELLVEPFSEVFSSSDRTYMVEFAHPNTHKAFHIGHLRNITTGETLVRLLEATGTKVIRANYQGDVGPHIAKCLWGIKDLQEEHPADTHARASYLGKAYAHGNSKYEEDSTVKEEIDEINKLLYQEGDNEWTDLYRQTRQWSLDYFEMIYKRVNSHFDRLYFESESAPVGIALARQAQSEGILVDGESGAVVFPGEKYGLHTRVFITGKGTPTYECKDVGLAKMQLEEYNPDKILHIVANEQKAYFEVVFKALEEIIPESKGREVHVVYGFVRLKDGKMSSRKGNVILGEQLLDDAKEAIMKTYGTEASIAEMVAVAAVKYSFLKVGTGQDIAFDLKESISLEGNSGPYLQYTYARANSVLQRAQSINLSSQFQCAQVIDTLNDEELSVLRLLPKFSEVVQDAANSFSPNLLCNYLFELAQRYNTFYNKHRILEAEDGIKELRLSLTHATGRVLFKGLKLLGIEAPERM